MIGSDMPGDSHIRDQNTNGPLSQRWQPVVRVYNLVMISTNLMNQITAIHRSPSPSLMAYAIQTALELREMKGEGQAERSCFWEDGKTQRKTETESGSVLPSLLRRRLRQRDNLPPASFIAHYDANLSLQRFSSMLKMWDLPCRSRRKQFKSLDLLEHRPYFDKPGQLYADVCWSMQGNWRVCIP